MSIKKTIGGNRLGSGKKMKVDLKSYERSTHDLSYAWRSTMATGTLVPFLSKPILPGSTYDIDLDVDVRTHPTIGPLFGSYKVQLDVFLVPMRLYIARLHNNESGLGMDMANVHIPQLEFITNYDQYTVARGDSGQVGSSCLLNYLGIRGAGSNVSAVNIKRDFNAIPYLAYWEIYKNYYANQQEEIGAFLNQNMRPNVNLFRYRQNNTASWANVDKGLGAAKLVMTPTAEVEISLSGISETEVKPDIYEYYYGDREDTKRLLVENFQNVIIEADGPGWKIRYTNPTMTGATFGQIHGWDETDEKSEMPFVDTFDIKNIDTMKRNILIQDYASPLKITEASLKPYGEVFKRSSTPGVAPKAIFSQQSLALKTYNNDMFNNWMNTEWIDGENGINSITAVQIVDDKLEIPSLILARKVFNVLNRIALSGGTYDDWLEVTYDHERVSRYESPAYMGGLIRELTFDEVISNAAAEIDGVKQPLGTLGGQGVTRGGKGGKVTVKTDEPAYVIGIMSITPRLDYSQGNQWDVNLKNMDELHKPELDQIGFQDLVTDQMVWWETNVTNAGVVTFKSAGKQPAWINYMTSVNVTKGNFAEPEMMWMTLNRRYERQGHTIKDLTSYIDPAKFNNIFAQESRDAQNFWVNLGVGITARQKMSAKVMPNL